MPRQCKLEDQCSVIAVFPLAVDDDNRQPRVCDSQKFT